jgi:hypothetical protein
LLQEILELGESGSFPNATIALLDMNALSMWWSSLRTINI